MFLCTRECAHTRMCMCVRASVCESIYVWAHVCVCACKRAWLESIPHLWELLHGNAKGFCSMLTRMCLHTLMRRHGNRTHMLCICGWLLDIAEDMHGVHLLAYVCQNAPMRRSGRIWCRACVGSCWAWWRRWCARTATAWRPSCASAPSEWRLHAAALGQLACSECARRKHSQVRLFTGSLRKLQEWRALQWPRFEACWGLYPMRKARSACAGQLLTGCEIRVAPQACRAYLNCVRPAAAPGSIACSCGHVGHVLFPPIQTGAFCLLLWEPMTRRLPRSRPARLPPTNPF